MESSLPRLRGLAISARTFRRIALANAVMLVVIVATGATVRLTGSGLGCPHWPGCQGATQLPQKGYHSYIEFSNRVVAALTIAITIATYVAARLARSSRFVRRFALATLLGAFAQAPLGAIVVYYHLNPWLVLIHFLFSLILVALAVAVLMEASNVRGEAVPARARALAAVVGAAAAVLVVSGTLVTASGPHPGSFGGKAVRRLDIFGSAVYWHVRATAVFGLSLALLLVWLWRRRSAHLRFGLAVVAVLAVQMTIGEIQYRTGVPWRLVLVHVTLAATLWAVTAAFVFSLLRPTRRRLPAPASGRAGFPRVRLRRRPRTPDGDSTPIRIPR
jgi:cytochrome c oxidase assembly protein subunit 15